MNGAVDQEGHDLEAPGVVDLGYSACVRRADRGFAPPRRSWLMPGDRGMAARLGIEPQRLQQFMADRPFLSQH